MCCVDPWVGGSRHAAPHREWWDRAVQIPPRRTASRMVGSCGSDPATPHRIQNGHLCTCRLVTKPIPHGDARSTGALPPVRHISRDRPTRRSHQLLLLWLQMPLQLATALGGGGEGHAARRGTIGQRRVRERGVREGDEGHCLAVGQASGCRVGLMQSRVDRLGARWRLRQ